MRITRDQLYIEVANLFAKRSTCYRQNIGAVIVNDRQIIAQGYNGPPSGKPHCSGQDCELTKAGGCANSIHAEVNALSRCPKGLTDLSIYVSQSPCLSCATHIIDFGGFSKVFYNSEYRLRDGINYLLNNNIEVYRITASGYIINAKDQTLCKQ